MDFDVVIQFAGERQAQKDIRICLCPGIPGVAARLSRPRGRLPYKRKAAPKDRLFFANLTGRSLEFGLGSERLHEVHELAANLGVADLDEGPVELETLGGRQEVDHIV